MLGGVKCNFKHKINYFFKLRVRHETVTNPSLNNDGLWNPSLFIDVLSRPSVNSDGFPKPSQNRDAFVTISWRTLNLEKFIYFMFKFLLRRYF